MKLVEEELRKIVEENMKKNLEEFKKKVEEDKNWIFLEEELKRLIIKKCCNKVKGLSRKVED